MDTSTDTSTSPSSYFSEPRWEPLCIIGGHSAAKLNAQIAVSVFGASIVPDRPRLLVVLWNANLTCSLVRESGTLAITVMSRGQLALFEQLGVRSGRNGDKLAGLDYRVTRAGDPWFTGCAGWLSCEVIDSLDLGDATLFVCGVTDEHREDGVAPVTWGEAETLLDENILRRYRAKFDRDAEDSRKKMHWLREAAMSA